jgi:hypothetical protein
MAAPVAVTIAIKAAIAAATDKRTWKVVGILIAAILTPFILMTVMILSLLSGTSEHNNAAVDLCFNGGVVASSAPVEYRTYIGQMSECFSALDKAVSDVEAEMDGGTLDSVRIKSIFYSLYFGAGSLALSDADARAFVDCFVAYEQDSESHRAAVPVSLETAYANLTAAGRTASSESKANAQEIYQRIAYGGAGSYTGEIEYGGNNGVPLEGLNLLHPESKNNLDLVAYAENSFASRWGYVWGTYGDVLTDSLFAYKLEQYPDGVGTYEDFIRGNWLGGRTTDCVGLIKGYGWFNHDTKKIEYGTNEMSDLSADGMYNAAAVKGSINTMPDISGLAVWRSGHIGIYIGNGEVIEAMGTKYGVVKTQLDGRGWKAWLEIPHIQYMME